jgi:hypothetical protein
MRRFLSQEDDLAQILPPAVTDHDGPSFTPGFEELP